MLFIGVDPGLKGAISAIDINGKVRGVHAMPYHKIKLSKGKSAKDVNVLDVDKLFTILNSLTEGKSSIILCERLFVPQSKLGRTAVFNFGFNWGLLFCSLNTYSKINHKTTKTHFDTPNNWMKFIYLNNQSIVKGVGKESNMQLASDLFGSGTLIKSKRSRTPHDGIADSLLIAETQRLRYINERK